MSGRRQSKRKATAVLAEEKVPPVIEDKKSSTPSISDTPAVPVQAESHGSALENVDDALVLDAPMDSDGDVTDISVITVVDAPSKSPTAVKQSDVPQLSISDPSTTTIAETDASNGTPPVHRASDVSFKSSIDASLRVEKRTTSRRRQWGSTGHGRGDTKGAIGITSDSLEKLIPTLSAEDPAPTTTTNDSTTLVDPQIIDESSKPCDSIDVAMPTCELIVERTESEEHTEPPVINHEVEQLQPMSPRKEEQEKVQKDSCNASPVTTSYATDRMQSPSKRKGPKETKAVGYLVEPPERVEPFEPPRHRVTDIVYIRFLVRPFTVDQLRQMITDHFGPVTDLWLNRIKSASIVRLDSPESATKCREGLDGSRWPSMNPRTLRCDFGNEALLTWMRTHGDSNNAAPPKHLVLGETESSAGDAREELNKKGRLGDSKSSSKRDEPSGDARKHSERDARDRDGVAQTKVPETDKKKDEPVKTLDDLFRKTTAAPGVYWLPLTDEEAKIQALERAKILATRRISRPTGSTQQRATRSPFTGPATVTTTTPTKLDARATESPKTTTKQSAEPIISGTNPPHPAVPVSQTAVVENRKPTGRSKDESSRQTVSKPMDRGRNRSPSGERRVSRDRKPESRRRERSPFTPDRSKPISDRPVNNKPPSSLQDKRHSSSATRTRASRSPSGNRPRRNGCKTQRGSTSSRSRSPSSDRSLNSGAVNSRRRGDRDAAVRPSAYGSNRPRRPRSKSVERRAVSPPYAGRSRR